MKNSKRQEAVSREGRREATGHARRIRAATDLTHCPDFDLQYGEEYRGGHPCSYYTLQYRGIKAHLRFDFMWSVKVPQLDIEKLFLNQPPSSLAKEIEDWIDDHIEPLPGPRANLRQASHAVRELAARHNISLQLADEIMLERGF